MRNDAEGFVFYDVLRFYFCAKQKKWVFIFGHKKVKSCFWTIQISLTRGVYHPPPPDMTTPPRRVDPLAHRVSEQTTEARPIERNGHNFPVLRSDGAKTRTP